MEQSMRITANSFDRHSIRLVREYEDVPEIVVEKHKVMQILVNLLRNAKDACRGMSTREPRVTVGIGRCSCGVRITVTDNGAGIAPENMTRIFTHGFTTKKTGHGFGLHSGALAAQELGGALRGESPGTDRGAIFTLELPLKPVERAA